ncbi:DJ-1/PfpI family protein [Lutibacter sp. A80]|uniref:BPL-N domain-containing protein n=1 Tax=Lutibacter sp. A80 TaxID=2918453 RepID=UPI001F0621E1|nr:BPL-N domain-containing protein [Lutibacter sp. A80]UMB62068.1 DJ-1/PfpI family protein [Lutibacter sp. A80]
MRIYIFIIALFSLFACNTKQNNQNESVNTTEKLKIAVFNGNGAGEVSVIETIEALKIDTGIVALPLSASEIQEGKLSEFDALIFPGGSGSKQLLNLGEKGQEIVTDFVVNQGKGIIGICAGAYLLSSTQGYPNLKLASSIHIDRAHYNRGRGLIEFELTKTGLKVFPELENQRIFTQYYDGPVLVKNDSAAVQFEEMGKYVTDIHPDNFAPEGITPGKTFMLRQNSGKGKVFLIAGHPESTPGMRWMVPRMARWVCGSELVNYNKKWVRPQINNKPIIFDKALKKEEKDNYWLLFSENSQEQIKAITKLHELRSRPAVRWNIGLLRSVHAKTRRMAAKTLKETEYTYAVPDIETALKVENDSLTKITLQESINFLNNK